MSVVGVVSPVTEADSHTVAADERLPAVPSLVIGEVAHVRHGPVQHAFRHRTYQWLVDPDRMPRLPRWLRPLSRIEAVDHLAGGRHGGIRGDLRHFLAGQGVRLNDTHRIVMLTNARVLGHVFDPLTVYWVLDADDSLAALVCEVHNTYGERHAYLLEPDEAGRCEVEKAFYVSPFNDDAGRYRITVRLERSEVRIVIVLERDGERVLTALTRGEPRPLTRRLLARTALAHPVMTQRVSALIRWHGVRLWLRRLPIRPRPDHEEPW